MSALFELRDLSVEFDVRGAKLAALDRVTLSIERGRSIGLVGESGSGKSTLARAMVGLAPIRSGSLALDGRVLGSLDDAIERRALARRVQIVFQDPFASLDPRQTVESIVTEPLVIQGLGTERERRTRVFAVLEAVGLSTHDIARHPHEFSGGQRQRIAIARALVIEPELLILDEPTSALDVSIRAQILNLLVDLERRFALTMLLISHDLAVVRHVCRDIAVMYFGRVVERGPAERVFAEPEHPYTQALLAGARELAPEADRAVRARAIFGEPPSLFAPPTGCAFHPRCAEREQIGARCAQERPELAALSREPDRSSACHLRH